MSADGDAGASGAAPDAAPAAPGSGAAGEGGAAEPDRSRRVELRRWNAVAMWSWDIDVDSCAICHNLVMETCIECQAGPSSSESECTVAWGVCSHAFHFHCISRWLRTRNVCPLDNQDWDFRSYG